MAVIVQAVRDWRRGSWGARSWLITEGLIWLDGCGLNVDPDYWQKWVLSGCPRYKIKDTENKMISETEAELGIKEKEEGRDED